MVSGGNKPEIDRVLLDNTVGADVDDEVMFTMPNIEVTFIKSIMPIVPLIGAFVFLFLINTFFKDVVAKYSFITVALAFVVFIGLRLFVNKSINNDEQKRKDAAVIVSKVFADVFDVVNN